MPNALTNGTRLPPNTHVGMRIEPDSRTYTNPLNTNPWALRLNPYLSSAVLNRRNETIFSAVVGFLGKWLNAEPLVRDSEC